MNERMPLPPTQPSPHRKRGEREPIVQHETVKRKRVVSDTKPVDVPIGRSDHVLDPDFVDFGPEVVVDESITGEYVEIEEGEVLADEQGNQFEFQTSLGKGGMGSVYKVKDLRTGLLRAMKFIHADVRDEPVFVERFKREIQVMAKMQNPFILSALDVVRFQKEGKELVGFMTEFVNGPDLEKEIISEGQIKPSRVVVLAGQMAFALNSLHKAGLIHRDIKPANILIQTIPTGEEFVRIGDFGIVGFAFESDQNPEDHQERNVMSGTSQLLTKQGTFVGTPGFVSPEGVRGKKIDHRSDLYAFGATLYQMITGQYPFDGDLFENILRKQISGKIKSFKSCGVEDVPEWLEYIVQNLLEPNPEDRFLSAEDVFHALKEGVEQDYPELLTTIPFIWDLKQERYDTSIRRAA